MSLLPSKPHVAPSDLVLRIGACSVSTIRERCENEAGRNMNTDEQEYENKSGTGNRIEN